MILWKVGLISILLGFYVSPDSYYLVLWEVDVFCTIFVLLGYKVKSIIMEKYYLKYHPILWKG